MEDFEDEKFLQEMETKLKLGEDDEQEMGRELTHEEKHKLAAA